MDFRIKIVRAQTGNPSPSQRVIIDAASKVISGLIITNIRSTLQWNWPHYELLSAKGQELLKDGVNDTATTTSRYSLVSWPMGAPGRLQTRRMWTTLPDVWAKLTPICLAGLKWCVFEPKLYPSHLWVSLETTWVWFSRHSSLSTLVEPTRQVGVRGRLLAKSRGQPATTTPDADSQD